MCSTDITRACRGLLRSLPLCIFIALGPLYAHASSLTGTLRDGATLRVFLTDGRVFALRSTAGPITNAAVIAWTQAHDGKWRLDGLPDSGELLLVEFDYTVPERAWVEFVTLTPGERELGVRLTPRDEAGALAGLSTRVKVLVQTTSLKDLGLYLLQVTQKPEVAERQAASAPPPAPAGPIYQFSVSNCLVSINYRTGFGTAQVNFVADTPGRYGFLLICNGFSFGADVCDIPQAGPNACSFTVYKSTKSTLNSCATAVTSPSRAEWRQMCAVQ